MESLAPAPAVSGARRAAGGGRDPLLPVFTPSPGPQAWGRGAAAPVVAAGPAAEERALPAPPHRAGAGGAVPGGGRGRPSPAAAGQSGVRGSSAAWRRGLGGESSAGLGAPGPGLAVGPGRRAGRWLRAGAHKRRSLSPGRAEAGSALATLPYHCVIN